MTNSLSKSVNSQINIRNDSIITLLIISMTGCFMINRNAKQLPTSFTSETHSSVIKTKKLRIHSK
ncbi:hypothetical protein ABIE12_003932 [Serratia sp. 509]